MRRVTQRAPATSYLKGTCVNASPFFIWRNDRFVPCFVPCRPPARSNPGTCRDSLRNRGSHLASLLKRGDTFYVSFYLGGREIRKSPGTDNLQLAKEKLRQFESAQLRGNDNPLPTRTPIAIRLQLDVVATGDDDRISKTPSQSREMKRIFFIRLCGLKRFIVNVFAGPIHRLYCF